MLVLLVMIQVFYCLNIREYPNIRSCSGNSSSTRPAYKSEYLYNICTLVNCTIKLTYFIKKHKLNLYHLVECYNNFFAAIELVIVLAWFLKRQRHIM